MCQSGAAFFPTGMHKVMLSERIQIVSVVREVFRSKVFCFGFFFFWSSWV